MILQGLEPNEKIRQDVLQVAYDKLTGVQFPEGDFESVMLREIDRAYAYVCNRIKTSLHPVRKTNLPKSPEEAYRDKDRFDEYIDDHWVSFPTWEQLTSAQKITYYANNRTLYTAGSLSWDLLTEEQRILFGTKVDYAANKISEIEKQDGKNTAYIKVYHGPISKFHSLALSFVNVPGYQNLSTFFRLYQPNEILVYEREAAIHIFPAVMARLMNSTQDPLYGSQFGTVAPRIPQVLHIDYEFGYREPPFDLLEAVAIRASIQILMYISNLFTGGLQGFGVQGFNVNFQGGMIYGPLREKLEAEFQQILKPYYQPILTGW